MQGRSASLVVSIAFSGLPRLLIGLTCLWSSPGGIYMVTNFLVNSVLAEIYFLVSSGECNLYIGTSTLEQDSITIQPYPYISSTVWALIWEEGFNPFHLPTGHLAGQPCTTSRFALGIPMNWKHARNSFIFRGALARLLAGVTQFGLRGGRWTWRKGLTTQKW